MKNKKQRALPPRHRESGWRGWGINERMSDELRAFSAANDLPLVDPRDRFLELLAEDVPRETYFLNQLDDHPNGAGYAEIATLVADAFEPRQGAR